MKLKGFLGHHAIEGRRLHTQLCKINYMFIYRTTCKVIVCGVMCAIACNHQYVLCMYVFHLSACNKLLIIINGYQ